MKILKSAFGKKDSDNTQADKLKQSGNCFTIDEQFMTPEFLYKPSKQAEGIKRLSKQFFLSLSTIESTFHLQTVKSHSLVEELVAMYQECVQVYDGQMDPIKYYFLDKIKSILTSADKFVGRNQSVSQYVQSSQNQLPKFQMLEQRPFLKEFEDFTDRAEKVTEFVTPRDEEAYIKQSKHEEILKKIDLQQQKISLQQQELYSIKKENVTLNKPQPNVAQPPSKLAENSKQLSSSSTTIQTQLENQELSIQARLQLRQRNQRPKKEG